MFVSFNTDLALDPLASGITPQERAARAANYITGTGTPIPAGSLKNRTFTLVGYGVDIGAKKAQVVVNERRSTTSLLKNVQTEVVTFQMNANNDRRRWLVLR